MGTRQSWEDHISYTERSETKEKVDRNIGMTSVVFYLPGGEKWADSYIEKRI